MPAAFPAGDTSHAAARAGKFDRVGEHSLLGLYRFNTGFSWSESGCPLCEMSEMPSRPIASSVEPGYGCSDEPPNWQRHQKRILLRQAG